MLVLNKENKLCLCCMEVHEVWTVQVEERMTFSNTEVSYPAVLALYGIKYREVEFAEGTGYLFVENHEYIPHLLSNEEKASIDAVIERFRDVSKKEIVKAMHEEDAYKCTEPYQVISYDHALQLSLC